MTEEIPGFERPPLAPFQTLADAHAVCDANIARINMLTHRVNTLSEKLARTLDAHNALVVAFNKLNHSFEKLAADHDFNRDLILDKYVPLYHRSSIRDGLWIARLIRHFRIQERNMTRLWTAVLPLVRKHNPALGKSLKLERGPQEPPMKQLVEEELAREASPLAAPAPETAPATTN